MGLLSSFFGGYCLNIGFYWHISWLVLLAPLEPYRIGILSTLRLTYVIVLIHIFCMYWDSYILVFRFEICFYLICRFQNLVILSRRFKNASFSFLLSLYARVRNNYFLLLEV